MPNARLQSDRDQFAAGETERGRNAGTKWATESASFSELRRLQKHVHGYGTDHYLAGIPNAPHSHGSLIATAILAVPRDERPDFGELAEFWDRVSGEDDPDEAFLEGFVDAALEVFNSIDD